MKFNVSHIINKILPVVNIGNEQSDPYTLFDSASSGLSNHMNTKDVGYALIVVKGAFSGLRLDISGQAPDGSFYALKVRNRRTGIISDYITDSGLYDVDVRGISAIRAYISNINSGAVSVFGTTQAIEPNPMSKEILTVRDEVNSGSFLSSGQLTFYNKDPRAIFSSTTPYKSITVKANESNVGSIYVGNNQVTESNGFILPPGSSTTIIGNFSMSSIWAVPEEINDGISYMGVR